jgi:DNA-binding MarR family transcriptional regulator
LQVYLFIIYTDFTMTRETFETAVGDFTQTIGLLVRRVRAAAASQEVSLTESSVMARLSKEGPATIADLARAEAMKPQSMGTTISALEQMGLVKRHQHPTDGRQINIELTAKGEAMRQKTRAAKRAWLAQAVAQLDKHDQATLFAAGQILKRLVDM